MLLPTVADAHTPITPHGPGCCDRRPRWEGQIIARSSQPDARNPRSGAEGSPQANVPGAHHQGEMGSGKQTYCPRNPSREPTCWQAACARRVWIATRVGLGGEAVRKAAGWFGKSGQGWSSEPLGGESIAGLYSLTG